MKVLYFHQHFTTPKMGGGIRSYKFAKKLIERGHQVTMVCGGDSLDLPKKVTNGITRGDIEGIDVIQIETPYSNNDSIPKRALIFLKYALKGVKIALNEEYDLLFATSTPLTAGVPGIFIKYFSRSKSKFVFEVRDLWPELPKALGLKNPFLLWGMSVLEKLSYQKADACVGLSPGICEGIKKRSQKGKVIEMIPNGCDLEMFKPSQRENLKLEGIELTDKVAVFTGAHGIANGLDAILDMASELKKRNRSDIKIAFIGDGKLKADLVERAKNEKLNNCLFYKPVSQTKISEITACADMGLMVLKNIPEFYYGTSPNKFFDYIASGVPVINNYPGWLADMITENNCGEVVEPNNPKDFADAVEKIADSKQLMEKYGSNSRKLAEKDFSRDILADNFVSLLEKVVKS